MRKIIMTAAIIIAITMSGFAQLDPSVTSWIINPGLDTGYNGILSNVQIVQYDTANIYISCTCIPGYHIGPWLNNPNLPSNQNFVFEIPRHPHHSIDTTIAIGLGHTGVWTNGVSIFNVSDAMSYNNDSTWWRNAYYFEGPGFDTCLGHPQQQGEYHHHVSPKCLYNDADSTHHSPIIGYAFDGFPVYGAYSYANTHGTGPIKRMRSSYQFRNITVRDTLPNGMPLATAKYGPAVSSTYPIGAFIQDYIYIQGSGDLDSNNGRFCITPDYPNGIYCYFVTIDSNLMPVFPYTFYGYYYGLVPPADIVGMGSGHVTITDSTHIYNPYAGIGEIYKHIKFAFYPNPVKDYAYIYFDPSSSNNISCSVYDTKGKLVEAFGTMQPSISYAFNFSKYANGIYFIHLNSNNEQVIQKFVKVK